MKVTQFETETSEDLEVLVRAFFLSGPAKPQNTPEAPVDARPPGEPAPVTQGEQPPGEPASEPNNVSVLTFPTETIWVTKLQRQVITTLWNEPEGQTAAKISEALGWDKEPKAKTRANDMLNWLHSYDFVASVPGSHLWVLTDLTRRATIKVHGRAGSKNAQEGRFPRDLNGSNKGWQQRKEQA